MDFVAGLPVLVVSLIAVVLFTWLQIERRVFDHNLQIYVGAPRNCAQTAIVRQRLDKLHYNVRNVVLCSLLAAPSMMAFSGQLDDRGIADSFNGLLQVIAPFVSACFSAAVAWLLIVSATVVHAAHCRLLASFRCNSVRKEFW
jgi:hypothetical protein